MRSSMAVDAGLRKRPGDVRDRELSAPRVVARPASAGPSGERPGACDDDSSRGHGRARQQTSPVSAGGPADPSPEAAGRLPSRHRSARPLKAALTALSQGAHPLEARILRLVAHAIATRRLIASGHADAMRPRREGPADRRARPLALDPSGMGRPPARDAEGALRSCMPDREGARHGRMIRHPVPVETLAALLAKRVAGPLARLPPQRGTERLPSAFRNGSKMVLAVQPRWPGRRRCPLSALHPLASSLVNGTRRWTEAMLDR
jgi:hypothetical protein